jgi:hypothetical protein
MIYATYEVIESDPMAYPHSVGDAVVLAAAVSPAV